MDSERRRIIPAQERVIGGNKVGDVVGGWTLKKVIVIQNRDTRELEDGFLAEKEGIEKELSVKEIQELEK